MIGRQNLSVNAGTAERIIKVDAITIIKKGRLLNSHGN